MDEHDRMRAVDTGRSGAVEGGGSIGGSRDRSIGGGGGICGGDGGGGESGGGGTNRLEELKRASLRQQAQRMTWEFGALVRRVRSELPDMYPRMRSALEALQLLHGRLAASDLVVRPAEVIVPAVPPVPAGSRGGASRGASRGASDGASRGASGGAPRRASGGAPRGASGGAPRGASGGASEGASGG